MREIKRELGGWGRDRSTLVQSETQFERAGRTPAREEETRITTEREGRKERKKERKKERAHPFDVSFARGIYKLLRRETWILCEEGGGSQKSFGQSGRSKIINFVFLPFFKRP